ncbi:MAG: aldehyde dehydrogenase family protein, partial [Micrococcales bacterium]
EEIVESVAATIEATPIGDPLDPRTVFGPSASATQQARVTDYIRIGMNEGARVATGGLGMPDGISKGFYVKPTVFADVNNSMRIAQEEIFGPVLVVIPYGDEQEAIDIANDSKFGLGGSIFTSDPDHGEQVARKIETGSVGINFYGSNLAAPFGGWKESGLGMEYGPEAIGAYVRMKSIHREG